MKRTVEIWLADETIIYRQVEFGVGHDCPDSFVTARNGYDPEAGNCRVERVRGVKGTKVIYQEVQK